MKNGFYWRYYGPWLLFVMLLVAIFASGIRFLRDDERHQPPVDPAVQSSQLAQSCQSVALPPLSNSARSEDPRAQRNPPLSEARRESNDNKLFWAEMERDLTSRLEIDEKRRAILQQVAAQSIQETMDHLYTEDLWAVFHARMPRSLMVSMLDAKDDLERDPRVAKLLSIIRSGTDEDKAMVRETLKSAVDRFLNELPERGSVAGYLQASVESPKCAIALPLILVEFNMPSQDLPLIVSIWERHEKAILQRDDSSPQDKGITYLHTHVTTVLSYAGMKMLDSLSQEAALKGVTDGPIVEYQRWRRDMENEARDSVAEYVTLDGLPNQNDRFAQENIDYVITEYLPHVSGHDPDTGFTLEEIILDFSRRVVAAAQ